MKKGIPYFDPEFTREPVTFTPEPKDDIVIDQEQFIGFSYTNSEFYKVTQHLLYSRHTGHNMVVFPY